ncbi:hypothetical protein EBN88_13420 [Streptomyces triticirhizae]|uniref:Uncharacterized protein n=1 Tax=Streptomyces triticirhizae TaxID=2483353 RepID=A0A3M2LU89_9ACTN|nr:hypothetical protein EBN88_13420 [Streptomyces triticirhizae]
MGRRTPRPGHIDGLSHATLAEVRRVERTRNHLWAGGTAEALRRWRTFVREPGHRLWEEPANGGCLVWACCGDPFEAREFLESVMLALSRRARSELRALVAPLDDLY